MHDLSDLIDRARRGEEAAFEALFDSVKNIALATARKFHPEQADDAVQEMRLRLWRSLPTFREGRGSFRAWCASVFRNLAVDLHRRKAARRRLNDAFSVHFGARGREPPRPDDFVVEEETRLRLSRLIDSIPSPTCQTAVRLRCLDDLDYDEIAARLGVLPISCRVYVHRGVREMRRIARRLGFNDPLQS